MQVWKNRIGCIGGNRWCIVKVRAVSRGDSLAAGEVLVTARLGIIGVPEDAADFPAICALLAAEPVFLVDAASVPPLPSECRAILLPEKTPEAIARVAKREGLAGLWSPCCDAAPLVAQAAAALGLWRLPCLDEAQQSTLPIDGATVYPFSELERLREQALLALPIPAWVRAACTRGDGSCMRLDHRNDLSLASAKLQKRNMGGPIRIQPALEGAVYRALAFKTGATLSLCCLIAEEMTSSVYRVPLSTMAPAEGRSDLLRDVEALAEGVNRHLPEGWGYVELEFVDTTIGLRLIDVQSPARLDRHLCQLVRLALGVDLRLASMACALGRTPSLVARHKAGAAMTWLLARSGVVTGIQGVDEARHMAGVIEVHITASEGDILSHVVDIPSRERGGYIIATGDSAAQARERLDAARARVWITTSPALL